MKGLLIEFDGGTGIRAGNLVLDDKLLCHGWQQLATTPCLEIRVIEDDRDVTQYEGIPGVTILHDDAEIQAAINEHCKPTYSLENETLFKIDLEQRGILLPDVPGANSSEQFQNLKAQGIKGIVEIRRPTLVEAYGPPETRAAKGLPE
ncbi:hypothetical protein ES708_10811 [subsurface metagenome]